jgi:predicted TIM-barrel fold metal-dependent hydrolase
MKRSEGGKLMPLMHAWLQQRAEAALDPDLPIIDPHHHLWPQHPTRHFSYLDSDLEQDLAAGHNIIATVFLQCRTQYRTRGPEHLRPVGETEWVNGMAERHAGIARSKPGHPLIAAGIVGFADLMLGERVDEVLDALQAAAPERFKGIRNGSTWSDDAAVTAGTNVYAKGLLMEATFRRGFSRLARRGLSFDGWMYHTQIDEFTDLARAFPDTSMVLNHLGGPLGLGVWANRGEEVFHAWKKSITALARCPNVTMKLGGAVMPVFGYHWEDRPLPPSSDELVAATGHYYRAAIDAFSPARCMFESNFPVDKQACGYVPLWNSFKKLASGCSASERADLFRNTAARVYRLEV